jgi:hypothetical protein
VRFSTLLTDGMFKIKLSKEDMTTLDQVFEAAAHHYWSERQAENEEVSQYHNHACEMHCKVLSQIICERGNFNAAVDPESEGRDQPAYWTLEQGPIATRDIFCNMLPDSRYWVGTSHPNDKILSRFGFLKDFANIASTQKL